MKKALIISGGVVGVALAALLVGPAFVDWSEYRVIIADTARQATGRDVEIGGDISFRILPSPALSAGDVRLANAEGGRAETLVSLESLDVKVAFLPLLSGEVQVSSVVLDSPVISLERLPNGRGNWEFETAAASDADPDTDAEPQEFSLDLLEIRDGQVSFVDLAAQTELILSDINAELSARSLQGPFSVDGAVSFEGVPVAVEANVGRWEEGRRTPVRLDVRLDRNAGAVAVDGSLLVDTEGRVSAEGRIKGDAAHLGRLIAVLQALGGDRDASGPELPHPLTFDGEFAYGTDGLSLSPVEVSIGDSRGNAELSVISGEVTRADITLAINSVELADWMAETDTAPASRSSPEGAFSLPETVDATFDLSIEAIRYNDGLIRQAGLRGRLAGGQVAVERIGALLPGGSTMSMDGSLRAEAGEPLFEGQMRLVSNNVRGLLTWAGVDVSSVPEDRLAGFSLDGRVRATPATVQIYSASGRLDISNLSGGASVALGGERAAFGVTLAVDRLNADSYSPAAGADGDSTEAAASWADTVASLNDSLKPLADINANLDVTVEQLTASGAALSDVNLKGQLADGNLALERLAIGNFEGARLNANGIISALGEAAAYDITIDAGADNATGLLRWLGMDLGIPPQNLSTVQVRGRIVTDLQNANFDLEGDAARGRYTLKGDIEGLGPEPRQIKAEVTYRHPDHTDLMARLMPETAVRGDPAPLSASLTVNATPQQATLDGRFELLGGDARLAGTVDRSGERDRFDLTLSADAANFTDLVQALGQDFKPSGDLGALRVRLALIGTEQAFAFNNIDAAIGETSVTGQVAVDRSGEISIVTGELTTGALLLDDFMQPATAGTEVAEAGGERWSRQQLDLSGLNSFGGNLKLRADEIRFRDYILTSPSATMDLTNGVLSIPDLKTGLFGGAAEATATLDARNTPTIDVTFRLAGAQAEQAFGAVAGIGTFAGRMDMNGAIAGRGHSQFEFISSLDGNAHVEAHDGQINGLNVMGLIQAVRGLNQGGFNLLTLSSLPNALRGGSSLYRSIVTDVVIQDGVARTENFVADIEQADLDGRATVNLPAWRIDAAAQLTPREPPNAQPINISITGDVSNPTYRSDAKSFVGVLQQIFSPNLLGRRPPPGDAAEPLDGAEPVAEQPKPEEQLLKGIVDLFGRKKKKDEDSEDPPPGRL